MSLRNIYRLIGLVRRFPTKTLHVFLLTERRKLKPPHIILIPYINRFEDYNSLEQVYTVVEVWDLYLYKDGDPTEDKTRTLIMGKDLVRTSQ